MLRTTSAPTSPSRLFPPRDEDKPKGETGDPDARFAILHPFRTVVSIVATENGIMSVFAGQNV
jgi:hypothetical protein